jgi:hypothetical protein
MDRYRAVLYPGWNYKTVTLLIFSERAFCFSPVKKLNYLPRQGICGTIPVFGFPAPKQIAHRPPNKKDLLPRPCKNCRRFPYRWMDFHFNSRII